MDLKQAPSDSLADEARAAEAADETPSAAAPTAEPRETDPPELPPALVPFAVPNADAGLCMVAPAPDRSSDVATAFDAGDALGGLPPAGPPADEPPTTEALPPRTLSDPEPANVEPVARVEPPSANVECQPATLESRTASVEPLATGEETSNVEPPPASEEPTVDDDRPGTGIEDTLSPAVRRLVRQYDLDITAIRGTGPDGRIRVSDVMALLGGRSYSQEPRNETVPQGRPSATRGARRDDAADAATERSAPAAAAATGVITTLFECDMTNVLAHRKRQREAGADIVLTSYYLVACSEALRAVPEVTDRQTPARLGAVLSYPDGSLQSAIVDAPDGEVLESLHDRLLAVDKELRFSARSAALNPRLVDLFVHHHGLAGSLVATPTPVGEEHAASVGIGRVRREIALRDEDATPRVAARCYVSLSFVPARVELPRANRFLAQLVRVLENWPL